ncbi:MAG: VOC family protein [Acidimicrobiales bacterium]
MTDHPFDPPPAHQPTRAIPVLPVADLVRAVAWYERLGFRAVADEDGYAILLVDGVEVHLRELGPEEADDRASVAGAYLRVADADATFERWVALGAPLVLAPTDQPYGVREFATEDPDGNLWRVGHVLDVDADDVGGVDEVGGIGGAADRAAGGERDDEHAAADAAPKAAGPDAPEAGGGQEGDRPSGVPQVDGPPRTDGGPGTDDAAWYHLVVDGATCAGCGLDIAALPARALGAEVRDEVHAFGRLLEVADDDAVRHRPAPDRWSALEYGVHVRDLLTVFSERIVRTLAEHQPQLGWWDEHAAIDDGMANESDVGAVVDDLGRNASKLSEALRMVGDEDWDRGAVVGDGVPFTIEQLARVCLHEVVHHRGDAAQDLGIA